MDRIGNEYVRGRAQVREVGEGERGENEMVWACA